MNTSRTSPRGFTLVEVMLALAILSIALIGLMAETASNIRMTQETVTRSVVVDLVRSKMYDIEAELLKDGFQELDQSSEGDFSEEDQPEISWEAKVEKIELPALNTLTGLQQEGEGAEGGEGAESAFANSPIGGLMASFGGNLGSSGAQDASFITSQFELIKQVLEAAIRKVTITAKWKIGKEDQEMVAVLYLTDGNAIDKVLLGGGRDDPNSGSEDSSGGGADDSGSGGGTGRGVPNTRSDR